MEKLWGGRFEQGSEAWVDDFGASIHFDYLLAKQDLTGSLAHVAMLKKTGILSNTDADKITQGLHQLKIKLAQNQLDFTVQNEDIHLNIEKLLYNEIGDVAGKLHTARSRNDQVATDMHLYLKEQLQLILPKIKQVQKVLVKQAEENIYTLLPGYTHLQHAQPISFAHHLLAYYEMLQRDTQRFKENLIRTDCNPLGACALAGTTFPIDRNYTSHLLDFSYTYQNSLDAVSDRDFILEFLNNSSLLMMHLSRFCEELILWSSYEFQFIEFSDGFSTGSSIMPQKKNPDMAELIRGKTGRVYGHLLGLLTVMKGLPLAYNKDLQEDKEGMFDTVKTLHTVLDIMAGMLVNMTVKQENMERSTNQDFSNATELADYLATLDIPFRKAHEIVGELVLYCSKNQLFLQDIPLSQFQKISPLITNDVYSILSAHTAVEKRTSLGGTGFSEIKKQVKKAKLILELD